MKFRDVQLLNSGKDSEEKLKQNRYLMIYWDNVRDLFCLHLPQNIELLDIFKLNIQFGEFEGDPFQEPDKCGIATFRRNDFSFNDFCNMPEEEKDNVSLGYIEASILAICEKFNISSDILKQFRDVAKKVRECGFEYSRIHTKTSKWHKSRKVRALTRLHFKKGGIDAHLEISNKRGEILSSHKIIDSRIWEGVWFDLWKGTWVGETFVIEGRTGEIFFKIESAHRDAI